MGRHAVWLRPTWDVTHSGAVVPRKRLIFLPFSPRVLTDKTAVRNPRTRPAPGVHGSESGGRRAHKTQEHVQTVSGVER